jgi:hypothetical protein
MEQTFNITRQENEPEWITDEPAEVVDGTEMLGRGLHLLVHINELMKDLRKERFVPLLANFKPLPLTEAVEKQNDGVFSKTDSDYPYHYFTFIPEK